MRREKKKEAGQVPINPLVPSKEKLKIEEEEA